jgi:antibiotic biosynthesis monooxygenase (ABM) superfamily enzyme
VICRIWYGWTLPQNADAYETLLRTRVFPGILARGIEGFHGIELLRRGAGDEVEFITLMRFSSMDAVKAFAGPQWEVAVVPPEARVVLKRFEAASRHYEVREARQP